MENNRSNTEHQQVHIIEDSLYGRYEQIVYEDITNAGHRQLASEGKYGWGMPEDPPTSQFVDRATDKVLLEVGTGLGDTTVLPALSNGARLYYATDISAEHLNEQSFMQQAYDTLDPLTRGLLVTTTLDQGWWDRPLQSKPTVRTILGNEGATSLPDQGEVDEIIARHSLQFGDPSTVLRFFDLAAAALKSGGVATAINFSPFTEYMYQYDQGETMHEIADLNQKFAEGSLNLPGGYMHRIHGPLKTSLAELMGKGELDRGEENRFLYFDTPTIVGLMKVWGETRISRGLPVNLELLETHYFTPSSIAKVNKLVSSKDLSEMENFVFHLVKTD